MSWSFKITNGDLDFSGPDGFATVTGTAKLIQDLKHWLLEPLGSDPFHPDYGSALNGGVFPDGRAVPSAIGGLINGESLTRIEAEVRRVLNAYRQMQVSKMQAEAMLYGGRNTLGVGEILFSINDVKVKQYGDTVLVNCVITTADGNQVTFQQSLK
ncbi:MAG: hypothetical protein QXU32_01730 [Nitrososphaerales archaeon]